jgi:hypothetical protein
MRPGERGGAGCGSTPSETPPEIVSSTSAGNSTIPSVCPVDLSATFLVNVDFILIPLKKIEIWPDYVFHAARGPNQRMGNLCPQIKSG